MKRVRLFTGVLVLVFFGLGGQAAFAQGFINPFIGVTLTSPKTPASSATSKQGFGVALGSLGGFIGGDTEFAYYPEVIDQSSNGLKKSRAVLFSGSTLIGPKIGPVKIYGAFGVGNMWLNVQKASSIIVPNPATISNTYLTFNIGGGIATPLVPHFGIRGDLRYHRAFGFKLGDLSSAGLALDRFDFWRAAGGLLLTF